MTKLFVGGLPYSTTNQELQDMFTAFGQVLSAIIVTDKFSGQSKGFGFVEMANETEAQKAIEALNGSPMGGRTIGVSVARPKEDRPRDNFNRGGFNRDSSHRDGGFKRQDRGGFRR